MAMQNTWNLSAIETQFPTVYDHGCNLCFVFSNSLFLTFQFSDHYVSNVIQQLSLM